MSKEYDGQDLLDIAARAEQDLNSDSKKSGVQDGTGFGGKSVGGGSLSSEFPIVLGPDSTMLLTSSAEEGGIDQSVTNKFPGSTAGKSMSSKPVMHTLG
jgi:hypothetical protein